jgi:STE24 endopeptidase
LTTEHHHEIRLTPPIELGVEAPDDREAGMTPQQLAEAKEYGRKHLHASLLDMAIDLVYLGVIALVFAVPLDRWLSAYLASDTLRLIALFAVVTLLHECFSFPVACYSGHYLEHRYGLSRQSFARWLERHFKHFGLGAALGLALFVGLFWIIRLTGGWWWLAAAGAFFVVSVVLSQLAPVVILPLFYRIDRLDSPELAERMSRLVAGTGLTIEGVYRMQMSDETTKANAMLAGLGRTRRVIMGDTLLDSFTPDEIEVIFAHEIGHHVHRHIRKMILMGLVFSVAGFWMCDLVLRRWLTAESGQVAYQELPVHVLPVLMFALTLFFLILGPVQNLISRHFERQCDRYALTRTRLRDAYLSAFRKLAVLNKDDPSPHPLEVFLFHSHPPIAQRLAVAEHWCA